MNIFYKKFPTPENMRNLTMTLTSTVKISNLENYFVSRSHTQIKISYLFLILYI